MKLTFAEHVAQAVLVFVACTALWAGVALLVWLSLETFLGS